MPMNVPIVDEIHDHDHFHGTLDPALLTSEKGIWAVKWSMVKLLLTALMQAAVVAVTSSVALLADTIHNFGDAATAIPLWIAILMVRKKPSKRFSYGYGRVEDLAGIVIVFIMLISGLMVAYESVSRLFEPQEIHYLSVIAVASLVGFAGMSSWRGYGFGLAKKSAVRPSSLMAITLERMRCRVWGCFLGLVPCGWDILRLIQSSAWLLHS